MEVQENNLHTAYPLLFFNSAGRINANRTECFIVAATVTVVFTLILLFHRFIQIPFLSSKHAEIAYNTLSVDAEPRRSGATKRLSFADNILTIELSAKEARQLRVSCNSIFDHVILVMQTIEQFGLSQ